jgi:hypothetical protein
MGEVIADKFQPETLMAMSNINLPTEVDLQMQAMIQQQQAQEQAQQQAMQQQAMMGHNGGPPMGAPAGMMG